MIQGSPAQLRELMTNLIFNAVDALPRGGTIRLRVVAEDGRGIIEVSDSGVGMSAEVQAQEFAAMGTFMEGFNKALVDSGELVETRGLTAPVHARRILLSVLAARCKSKETHGAELEQYLLDELPKL